jgi:hypothetical protein
MTVTQEYEFDVMSWLSKIHSRDGVIFGKIRTIAKDYFFDAEDIAQEVAEYVWEHRQTFMDNAKSDGYLVTSLGNIARNICRDRANKEYFVNDNKIYSKEYIRANLGTLVDTIESLSALTSEKLDVSLDFQEGWKLLSPAEAEALLKSLEFRGDDSYTEGQKKPKNTVKLTPNERSAESRGIKKIWEEMNRQVDARTIKPINYTEEVA